MKINKIINVKIIKHVEYSLRNWSITWNSGIVICDDVKLWGIITIRSYDFLIYNLRSTLHIFIFCCDVFHLWKKNKLQSASEENISGLAIWPNKQNKPCSDNYIYIWQIDWISLLLALYLLSKSKYSIIKMLSQKTTIRLTVVRQ